MHVQLLKLLSLVNLLELGLHLLLLLLLLLWGRLWWQHEI